MADRALGLAAACAAGGLLCLAAEPWVGTLANSRLHEISGLARSAQSADVLWAHNDSGDGPVLYRVGTGGEDRGSVAIPDAQAVDWEDLAAFEQDGEARLLIGDVGDNGAVRESVTLYAVRDPGDGADATLRWRVQVRYPDGPRDCESIAVDPASGDILLLSKRDRPPRLYRLPLPASTPGDVQTAEFLGTVDTLIAPAGPAAGAPPWGIRPHFALFRDAPTALDLSADGRLAVVVTLSHAYLFRRAAGQTWLRAFAGTPRALPLPHFRQIESAALSADGRWLHIASEGSPPEFARLRLPP